MNILGIPHPISVNTAAVLLIDGRVSKLVEEERFLRIKQAPFKFPFESRAYCLSEIKDNKIDAIGIGYSRATRMFRARLWQAIKAFDWDAIPGLYFRWMRWLELERKLKNIEYLNAPAYYVRHHVAHGYSAYFSSGFEEAIVLTLDGSSGEESGLLNIVEQGKFKKISSITDDESWG